jgi:hypothetical protein
MMWVLSRSTLQTFLSSTPAGTITRSVKMDL